MLVEEGELADAQGEGSRCSATDSESEGKDGKQSPASSSGAAGSVGNVNGIHAQDPIHVAKRLRGNIDSTTRDLTFGNSAVASMAALDSLRVFGNDQGKEKIDTGLILKNTQPKDRQNWPATQAIFRRKVRHALWQHQRTVGGLQGLIIFLEMAWKYTHLFFSRVITFRERIEHACYIIHFLRLWRAWVYLQDGYTVTKNFLTRETFVDTVMSCHSAILVILLYAMHRPETPLHMDRIGTDCVETHFSAQGSWVVNKRDYTYLTMLRMLHKMNWLIRAVTADLVNAPKVAHHNDTLWRQEDKSPPCACFGCSPSVQSAATPGDLNARPCSESDSDADDAVDTGATGCPCPVAACKDPGSCKNDLVGTAITPELVATIWKEQFMNARRTLALVGVGPEKRAGSVRKTQGAASGRSKAGAQAKRSEEQRRRARGYVGKQEGDGETLWDNPDAMERWLLLSGWWSGKHGSDAMAADSVNEPVGEGTDNRPDSSLLGRYMRVPMAHFGTPGGCEEVCTERI